MPIVSLNAAFSAAAECQPGKKKTDYWDTVTTGFVLEVRPSGSKTYSLRFIDGSGIQRQHKIGGFADITFGQAQKEAKRLRSEVVLGGNPAARKEKKKAIPTYAALARQHLDHARTYQKRPENTDAVLRVHLIPRWGHLRLDEIKQQEVSRWLSEKRKELAPATVEKMRMILGRSFELARQWQIPGAEINPVRGVPTFKFSNARERFLTAKEADRLLEAAARSPNPQLRAIIQLLLLTGARKSELLTAEWKHVDTERNSWFIPDSKTGKSRHVPLSKAAVAVIENLLRFDGCPYLLPNPKTRKPYNTIKRAWATAKNDAQLGDFCVHDLRHAAASFWVSNGVDIYTVGRLLGHQSTASSQRYSHIANDTLLAAVEAGAAGMAG